MRYLVTGASGLIGWQLVDRLAKDGHQVNAWLRQPAALWQHPSVAVEVIDLADRQAVAARFAASCPDRVVHLAAQSLPGKSWQEPAETMHANIDGTLSLLEAMKAASNKPRLLFAGTSAQYASSKDGSPIREDAPLDPSSPYAVSKMAAEDCCRLYARAFGLDVICFRPFLWIGPRKTGDVASDVARRIVAIEGGATPVMGIGRTDVVRDFLDINDGIAALLLLSDKGAGGEAYNICNGQGLSIRELIEAFRAQSRVPFALEQDIKLMRPIDEMVRIGDAAKMHSLGWRPQLTLEDSVRNILGYWRSHLR
jgi:GDP-4-dehydro-6-deoxy-D-mannose reductase